MMFESRFNSLPDNFQNRTKLKAFADDKSNAGTLKISVFNKVENIVGKGENAGYRHFLLFQHCFQQPSLSWSVKVGIVWYRVKCRLKSSGLSCHPRNV